jgi:hypothetical protein
MRARSLLLLAPLALAACKGGGGADASATEVPKEAAGQAVSGDVIESEYGTPVKDRVATLGLLNKRNNLSQDVVLKTGEAKRIGNVTIRLATCERSLPWESPPEVGAFVQVFVEEQAAVNQPLQWRKVFSGWMFKNSPSLNVVEHPIYDVWVKDCAMKFPGEEDSPAPAASASSAPKPAGSASGAVPAAPAAPKPSPSPAPKPSTSAAPSVDL